MSDTLEIFGQEWTNVAGFKATDDNNATKTYIRPQGTKSISANGTGIDVAEYASVDVAVPSGSPSLQSKTKTYTPSTSQQTETISPDSGYDGLSSVGVTVNAMPAMTLPTSASSTATGTNKATIAPSTSTQYINIPTGYNASAARYTLSAMTTMTLPTSASASSSGTSKATITPTESNQYINIPTGYNSAGAYYLIAAISNTYVGSGITRRSSSDLTASNLTVTAPSGYYQSNASKTLTDANLVAGNIKKNVSIFGVTGSYEGSGGGGSSEIAEEQINYELESNNTFLTFEGLQGEPKSFSIMYDDEMSVPSTTPYKILSIVYDGTDLHVQTLRNTSNAQATYEDGTNYTMSYNNGTLEITSIGGPIFSSGFWALSYTYGGSSGNIGTSNVQVGSGATSITFPNIEEEPFWWALIFKSNFGTSSGYQRVIAVRKREQDSLTTNIYGFSLDSSAHGQTSWSESYSNGSLTVSSTGTNNGGYFHQPGYYELVYATSSEAAPVEVEPLSVTENGTYQESGKAYSPVVVNVSGGGSAHVATTTWTNSSNTTTSHQFTGLSGTPKAAFLRCTSSLSRSSNSTNYFVADMVWNGTSCSGNSFRRSNGTYANVTSGYSVSVSGTSITFTSSGTSTTNPGSFYNGTYELVYVY